MRKVCVALALSAMAAVLLTACGGGSDSDQTNGGGDSSTVPPDRPVITPSMPMTKQLAVTFPLPKPEPGSPSGTAAAIEAGRKACQGKTPIEVREAFIESAKGLNEGQQEMLDELPKYERQAGNSPDFAAGQLAAGVYEATLPEAQGTAGYQGCVYELALQLRRELAKK
jgi:hypothetical protein